MSDPRKAPSIFTRGAVDLGALRARTAPSAPAAASPQTSPAGPGVPQRGAGSGQRAAPASGNGAAVIEVTEATFQSEVMERSLRTPVLVNFLAGFSPQSQQLTPLLEKLALEAGGAWVLANVDVEANPRLAQMLRLQSVPMVYAIVGGQPVDAFGGVVPENQLRQWIAAVCGVQGGPASPAVDPRMELADDALAEGDLDGAEQAYRKILAESPADVAAESGLAQVALVRRVSGVDPAKAMAAAASTPNDVAAQTLAADVEVLSGRAAEAYQRLVDLVRRISGDERETVRKHLLSLFTVAGPDDPAVAVARRALASALF